MILKENVEHLGQIGDVVRVSNGYARNFLLPRNLVVVADQKNIAELEHHKRILGARRAKQKGAAEEVATKLADISCTITRKAGKNDKLFGSVTSADIAAELEKSGFEIKKSSIKLAEPIKELGVKEVEVRIQPDVIATVKVWVAKEEE